MSRTPFQVLLPLALLAPASPILAQSVSPNDRTALEGSSFTHYPLGRANARMQQLHNDVPAGAVLHGHAYRRDAGQLHGRVDTFAVDLAVSVSTSPNDPSHASTTFANNIGGNAVAVVPRTILTFPATDRPALDPAPTFDLIVPYAVPFVVPATGGTVCVDTEVFGNTSAGGANRNLSIYLDAHQGYTNGRAEQEGFRTGVGCPAPGQSSAAYANLTLWHLGNAMQFDVAERNGVPDDGTGATRAWLAFGAGRQAALWPTRPDCTLQSTADVWYALPGTMDTSGSFDGSLGSLPVLPAGFRMWCQTGSAHLGNGGLAFGDLSAMTTPPAAPATLPAARVAHATDHTSATGSVSLAVPVTLFF